MTTAPSPFAKDDLYVSPGGNDRWSGRLAQPNPSGTDGPLATLDRARKLVREFKRSGKLSGPITVWLRGGRYPTTAPVAFAPEDSYPVTYSAYPDEQPILDGGQRIGGWKPEKRGDREVWTADLPAVAAGQLYFRSLFVNGQRRPRAHYPKTTSAQPNWLRMESVPGQSLQARFFDGADSFIAAPGDVTAFKNLADVEVVALHYWIEERMPIASYDPQTRRVTSPLHSMFSLRDEAGDGWARYYLDNVFEHLSEPGEWYLDRSTGTLHYIPMPGEKPESTDAIAPLPFQMIQLEGAPDQARFVEFIRFRGLTFEHTDWDRRTDGADPGGAHRKAVPMASAAQSAYNIPAIIQLRGARNCAVEECTIRHGGWYGVELLEGCTANRIIGNEIADLGAGGIKLNGATADEPRPGRTGQNLITDNHIHFIGRVFHSACGILARHTFGNTIAHNHIHDGYYTGISIGWVWGFDENVARDNLIEKNHIHDLGHGWLSDLGGIYTLGVQPGTIIRGNLIHDIRACRYGGWGIYPDEGSSHLIIENNICYATSNDPFHQHYGRENIVRNNIFAFGDTGQIALGRATAGHLSFTFERNIILTRQQPVFEGGYGANFSPGQISSDLNLFWSTSGAPIVFQRNREQRLEIAAWQALGHDRHSLIVDPRLADANRFDFRFSPNSPALPLGITPIDLSDVGPRADHRAQAKAADSADRPKRME